MAAFAKPLLPAGRFISRNLNLKTMEFKTKFEKGERAWYMKNNKPTEVIISAIEIFYVGTNQDRISYNATDAINPVTWLDHTNLHENMLYKSKQELIEAL